MKEIILWGGYLSAPHQINSHPEKKQEKNNP